MITLGIGTPSSILQFLLVGLEPASDESIGTLALLLTGQQAHLEFGVLMPDEL